MNEIDQVHRELGEFLIKIIKENWDPERSKREDACKVIWKNTSTGEETFLTDEEYEQIKKMRCGALNIMET